MSVTPRKLIQWKQQGRPIVALTAWDYAIAQTLDRAGVDVILVGDSLAMVALGYETTLPLTLEETLHHAKAVRRGVKEALVVVDLPFLTYQESPQQALHSAGRVLKETGAEAVKLEGGYGEIAETVSRLVQAGIPVMGHVGLTPQSVHQLGYRQQGKTETDRDSNFIRSHRPRSIWRFCHRPRTYPRRSCRHHYRKNFHSHDRHWCGFPLRRTNSRHPRFARTLRTATSLREGLCKPASSHYPSGWRIFSGCARSQIWVGAKHLSDHLVHDTTKVCTNASPFF